jgi:hypothetical protein
MARTEPTIANYDARTADEITQRLRNLSQTDLAKLETYERRGQNRSTVLERIASLRGDTPWPGYDEMEVEEVNDALKHRNGDVAARVLAYERQHKGRTSVIDFAKRRQAGENGSSARPRSTARRTSSRSSGAAKAPSRKSTSARKGSAAKSRSRSTGGRSGKASASRTGTASASRPRASSARKGASASSRSGSAAKSRSRSSGGRSGKASPRRTAATSASRPRATSEAQRSGSASRGSRSKSSSGGASRARVQARSSSRTRSRRSGAPRRRAPQTVPARLKQRVTGAVHSGERRTERLAKDAGQAVGTAAKDSRDAIGSAARDAGRTAGSAANKAKGPVLMGGAVLAALGGGIALGRGLNVKLRKRKRVLGVPIPRRTAVGKAAKRVGSAVDSVGSTGHQIGRWSDDLQELRRLVAGKSPTDKVTDRT